MKSLLRAYTFHLLTLWLIDMVLGESFNVGSSFQTILIGAGVLAVLTLLLKPILKLLFLPINALTLGLFTLVINAGVFYLFIRLVPSVSISSWQFPGFSYNTVEISSFTIPYAGTLFLASFLQSVIINFFVYLVE